MVVVPGGPWYSGITMVVVVVVVGGAPKMSYVTPAQTCIGRLAFCGPFVVAQFSAVWLQSLLEIWAFTRPATYLERQALV